jgi:hypothetical protein
VELDSEKQKRKPDGIAARADLLKQTIALSPRILRGGKLSALILIDPSHPFGRSQGCFLLPQFILQLYFHYTSFFRFLFVHLLRLLSFLNTAFREGRDKAIPETGHGGAQG